MSSGVSDELRKLALRKLFHGVGFNIRDGLDDYDEDFTSFAKLGDIVTSDMRHQAEVKARKAREEAERLQAQLEGEQGSETEGQEETENPESDQQELEHLAQAPAESPEDALLDSDNSRVDETQITGAAQ